MIGLITLDYELFFGRRAGSAARCLAAPTDALLEVASRHGAGLTFFVDAGYLEALDRLETTERQIARDRETTLRSLERVVLAGHDVQLHIHPHWEDSTFSSSDSTWDFDLRRYRLHSHPHDDISRICESYTRRLRELTDNRIFAFRAGGWSCQPFPAIASPLWNAGVRVDSSVYPHGFHSSQHQQFDFRSAPVEDIWRFDEDPCQSVSDGRWIELPMSPVFARPFFYWRLLMQRVLKRPIHQRFGDGFPIESPAGSLAGKLCRSSTMAASIDGAKCGLLPKAASAWQRLGHRYFTMIGHPKALTPASLDQLDRFLGSGRIECTTISEAIGPMIDERPAKT